MTRARNEGTIRQRKDGRWEVRIRDPLSGRRRSLFAPTEQAALDALKAAHRSIDDGVGLGDARLSVERYLLDWLDGIQPTIRLTTHSRYAQIVRLQVIPRIGKVRLRALTPAHLRKLYAQLQTEPRARRKGRAPLAPRTVGHVHRVLHNALEQAARDGLVARNIASLVSPPKVPHHEMTTLTPEQVRALLAAAEDDRHEALFVLAVTTGLRLGEMLALAWPGIDLEAGTVRVRRSLAAVGGTLVFQEPKTPRSRRTVTLTKAAVAALKTHRKRQAEERLAAIGWEDHGLVFPGAIGRPQHPSNVNALVWRPLRAKAGLPPGFRFHDLRHTAASLALAAGVPVTTVSEMLGHANTAVTLSIYAHAVPGSQQQAADAMDALLTAAGKG